MSEEMIRVECVPCCPLCGNGKRTLYSGLSDRLFGTPGEWTLNECLACKLVFLSPRPIEADIGQAYKTYYTHQEAEEDKQRSVRWLIAKKAFYSMVCAAKRLSSLSEMKSEIQSLYLHKRSPGKLLDVGCGKGRFLRRMRDVGWVVEGVDPDEKAANAAQSENGLKVHVGDLQTAGYPDNCFDAVTMNHVIEHVHDPIALLQECYRILKPSGALVVVTPNVESWGHKRFSRNWRGLEPPRHLHVFSRRTLRECATRTRFGSVRTWTTPANAEIILRATLSIRLDEKRDMRGELPAQQLLLAHLLQHWEAVLMRRYPEAGEEAVLWAEK